MDIVYRPIGIIHSPFRERSGMPIQPTAENSAPGTVEVFEAFAEGLEDVDGFSHVFLLYHLHEVRRVALTVTPFLDTHERGVFATRAPTRPNPIGLSIVALVRREGPVLHVADIDVLDGTPLLDIKPYVPEFDRPSDVRCGWIDGARRGVAEARSDDRFQ